MTFRRIQVVGLTYLPARLCLSRTTFLFF